MGQVVVVVLGGAAVGLLLRVADFAGPRRWRWLLSDEGTGEPLADHEVRLDGAADEYVAFADLYRFLRWNAVPDRRAASEAEIVARVGAWAGREVLGGAVGRVIVGCAPVTVRVVVPVGAGFVLGWPLELAHVGGRPLAARDDVTFVYDLAAGPDGPAGPGGLGAGSSLGSGGGAGLVGGRLRMLAVFSLPTATSVLGLRRERYELVRLVRRIAARQRRLVELRVVQYGVTRERLAEIVDDGDGWDVLHLSGHGGRGQFVLETVDGSADLVGTAELVGMLRPLRRRVRLAVVSACESAAAATAETLRWVGLTGQAEQLEQQAGPAPAGTVPAGTIPAGTVPAGTAPAGAGLAGAAAAGAGVVGGPVGPVGTGIARALVEQLGCAVVAMRYPVTDEFATAFTGDLYERMLGRGQRLGTALARAVAEAAGPVPSPARPALCLATPALFGGRADTLVLQVPAGDPGLDPALVRMERFPREPARFVGRAGAMARASAALAAGSGRAGVLLHGMAGSGKTACALELAYRHQDSFAAVAFWQAPEHEDQFAGALAGLAAALDIQLGGYGFAMSDKITSVGALEVFVPRLTRLLEDNGILLVLDNLETLLTSSGGWRDPRWVPLSGALCGHRGESRVVVTSRVPPAGLAAAMVVVPVHALALDEAVALARELPGLRGLLHADSGPLRAGDEMAVARDRDLVRRVLHVVQGHPKLMELADAAAADPGALAAQLAGAEAAADGRVLDAFFRDGTTRLGAADFLGTLAAWTTATVAGLPGPAQLMAQFLACHEEGDRFSVVVDANWADLWRRLGRAGDPPAPEPLLGVLAGAALIQPDPPPHDGNGQTPAVSYRMHPGVAQAIRAAAGPGVREATDTELAEFWRQVAGQATEQEGGEAGQLIVRAGLAAAPYLLRRQDWDTASWLLEQAVKRDSSPGTIQAALPSLRAIARATRAAKDTGRLARALQTVDPAEAEQMLRDALAQAVASGDFRLASAATGDLVNLLRDAGRLREALDLSGQKAGYTREAGLGAWTQLQDQAQRLQILGLMGEHQQVLDETGALRAQMDQLPAGKGSDDAIDPWNARELILDIARSSALALGEWQQCLDLNAAILASEQARGASAHEIAAFRRNDAVPLIRLGRLDDAEQVLIECQQVFEDHDDLDQLARVFSARADLEDERGNLATALGFQQTAIRFTYTRPDPRIIAIAHGNLAYYLRKAGSDPAAQRAHRLAAALIYQLTGMTHNLAGACEQLAGELCDDSGQAQLPATVADVVHAAEQTEGVHLGQLLTTLAPGSEAAAAALTQILDTAAMPSDDSGQDAAIAQHLHAWEPIITATVAAAGGDGATAAQLAPELDQLAQRPDWAALVAVLRRILDGDRGTSLLGGLDPIDTAIAGEVLTRLTPPPAGPPHEHP